MSDMTTVTGAAITVAVAIVITIVTVATIGTFAIVIMIMVAVTAVGAIAAIMVTGHGGGCNKAKHHENYEKTDKKLHTLFS
jgi:hypothetical protein